MMDGIDPTPSEISAKLTIKNAVILSLSKDQFGISL